MELLVLVLAAVGIVGWWILKERKHEETGHPLESLTKKMDINHDGKVDAKDAVTLVAEVKETVAKETVAAVTAVADLNKDGKVDKEDVKVVVEKTKKAVNKTKAKVVETAEKVKKSRKSKK